MFLYLITQFPTLNLTFELKIDYKMLTYKNLEEI